MNKNSNPACILWGAYGNRNTGDQLTLAVALNDARSRFGDSVAVISSSPEYTKWNFPDVQVIPYRPSLPPIYRRVLRELLSKLRYSIAFPTYHISSYRLSDQYKFDSSEVPPWVRAIRNSSHLYLVGGGYLTDVFDLDYFLLPLQVASSASVRVETAPIGLGPFASKNTAASVADCLRNTVVVVRDESSLEYCRLSGISAVLQKDDGFRVKEVMADLPLINSAGTATNRPRHRPLIGVCISKQGDLEEDSQAERWWIGFLSVLRKYDLELECFCFHPAPHSDFSLNVRLLSASGWDIKRVKPPTLDFRATISALSRYDAIVSTRFHSIVIASVLGISSVALASGKYYTGKMTAAQQMSGERCRLVKSPYDSPEEIVKHILKVCNL